MTQLMRLASGTATALLAFIATPLAAQNVTLPPADLEFAAEFTSVYALIELQGGVLLVVDSRERRVLMLGPRPTDVTQVSREGAGPTEVTRPREIVRIHRDSLLIADGANNRFLVLDGTGRPIGTVPSAPIRPSPSVAYFPSWMFGESTGSVYFELPRGLTRASDGRTPVVRYRRDSAVLDTAFHIQTSSPVRAPRSSGTGTPVGMGTFSQQPFVPRDGWAVAFDGSIGIVRAESYRVEWILPSGRRVVGPDIAIQRVAVTALERAAWRSDMARQSGTPTTTDAAGRTTTSRIPVPEPEAWPDYKPAIVPGSVRIAENGDLWVERHTSVNSPSRLLDVFDRSGQRVLVVEIPRTHQLVGFGARHVYMTAANDDELLRISRHPYPRR